jgi:pilus assembly protein CpaB
VAGGGDGAPLRVSETIIRNIRVLATDQRIDARDENGNQVAAPIATVTLEATPRIAEKIAVAQTIGQISLSLRSIADNNVELERAIASGEVQVPQTDDPNAERQMLIAIASQPLDANPTFTVGGDVSRFQRRNVPGRGGDGNAPSPPSPQPQVVVQTQGGDPSIPRGPTVRVARGNAVTVVPVGGQ